MNGLTPLEAESKDTLVLVREALTSNKPVGATAYRELMNVIRLVLEKLQNKEHGCDSGKHASFCTCKPGVPGVSVNSGRPWVPKAQKPTS